MKMIERLQKEVRDYPHIHRTATLVQTAFGILGLVCVYKNQIAGAIFFGLCFSSQNIALSIDGIWRMMEKEE